MTYDHALKLGQSSENHKQNLLKDMSLGLLPIKDFQRFQTTARFVN